MSKKSKCKVCSGQGDAQLEQIRTLIDGGTPPETVAARFRIDYDDMIHHVDKCLAKPEERNPSTLLNELLEKSLEMMDLAMDAYREDPGKAGLLMAVTGIVGDVKDTVKRMQGDHDPESILHTMIAKGLNPMVNTGMRGVALEWAKQKTELSAAGVKAATIDSIGTGVLTAYGQSMKQAQLYAIEQIGTELGIPKKRIAAMIAEWQASQQPAKP